MTVAALFMLWYDGVLFLVMVAMAPVLYELNRRFRIQLSRAYRDVQESFSRLTGTLAESVSCNGLSHTSVSSMLSNHAPV